MKGRQMANRKGVTPEQLRQLSKELSLTVAAIAEGTGLSKAYVSEFRNETRNLSLSQETQLRAFLDEQCESQGVDFPEIEAGPSGSELAKSVGGFIQRISRPAILLSDELPKAQIARLTDLIEANRLKVADILAEEFTPGGLLGGDFSEATEEAIRQTFALLALNYVAILILQGSNIVRKLPQDYELKTMGDWLSQYLTDSPLAELLPADPGAAAGPVKAQGALA
jgi:transcriptional regulator with XRE-family HTH domain